MRMSGSYGGGVPLVEVVRSGFVEGRHHGSFVALAADGGVTAAVGDVSGAVFPRSSNKPMQAAAMLASGLVLDDAADVAQIAASHFGEPFHVARVQALLDRGGLTQDALACPPDLPLAAEARAAVLRAGGGPERRYMNCSGKHAGMLLTCLTAGWPIENYVDPTHPLQVACRDAVERLAGERVTATGVDGCGATIFALSLTGLARAFLACVQSDPSTPERRVADAMRAFPEIMSGTGADDAKLMHAVPGLLTKGGAEGVAVAAVPGVGAVAVKIDDGADRARPPLLNAALRRLGVQGPADLDETPLLGGGVRVGGVRVMQGV